MADLVNSDGKKRIEWVGLLFLLALSAGWGFNWVVMKNLIAEWPPLSSRGLAGIDGALGLMLAAKVSGESLKVAEGELPRLLLASFLNVTVWIGVGGRALCHAGARGDEERGAGGPDQKAVAPGHERSNHASLSGERIG